MFNKKRIYSILLVAALSLSIYSCGKSFLDIPSTGSIDASKAINNISGLKTNLNGVYNLLQSDEIYGRSLTLLPDLMSDNVYVSDQNSGRYLDYNRYNVRNTDGTASDLWDHIYRLIANCNIIINSGKSLMVESDKKDEKQVVVGQAYALRALGYFNLVRLFAQPYNSTSDASQSGVPLVIKTSISLPKKVNKPKRSSVKKVYDRIISDFKNAINLLPTTLPGQSSSFKGKITKNAAKALLSRVYLYTENWKGSKTMASDVINSGQYQLLSTNDLVSDYSENNSSESIFEIVNTDDDNEGTNSLASIYNQNLSYGDMLATYNLYNIYAPTDVRQNFMEIGDRKQIGAEKNVPLVLKYKSESQDITVIRLAEMYLNRAEAEAHLKQLVSARTDLERIAKRADPNVSIDSNLSGKQLINRILLERRKEFAFEGQHLFDLTRNKKSFTKYRSESEKIDVKYPSNKTILPIPESAIDVNPNLTQNSGYGSQ
jgi:hypothetical protein